MHNAFDSKRNRTTQGPSSGVTATPVAILGDVGSGGSKREIPERWRLGVQLALRETIRRKGLGDKTTREQAAALGMKQPTFNELMNMKGSLGTHVLVQVREATGYSIDEMLLLKSSSEAQERRAKNRAALDEIRGRMKAIHALVSVSGPLTKESRSSVKRLLAETERELNLIGGDIGREEKAEVERDVRIAAYEEQRRAAG